jgi:hypothetical protein
MKCQLSPPMENVTPIPYDYPVRNDLSTMTRNCKILFQSYMSCTTGNAVVVVVIKPPICFPVIVPENALRLGSHTIFGTEAIEKLSGMRCHPLLSGAPPHRRLWGLWDSHRDSHQVYFCCDQSWLCWSDWSVDTAKILFITTSPMQ